MRAGYPDGVPGPDRVPLLALLRNTPLTEDEVRMVVRNITAPEITGLDQQRPAGRSIGVDEIEAFIAEVTHRDAGPENVRRVADRLAAVGWTLGDRQ